VPITGSQAVKEIFCREGVEYIFGIPGATEAFFMDALEDCPDIRYILALHEVVAMGAAEGYARTSGKPGILNLHTGTGLGASLPLLSNAYNGGVPLIVTAGQQDTRLQAYDPHLAGDLVNMARPFTKWATEIRHVEDISTIFRRAFKIATQPPTGPVFISLPQDVMSSRLEFEYVKGNPLLTGFRPDPESIDVAVNSLVGARNPVIILQDGVAKSGALPEVVRLAETIGARVYQPWMGDVNFPLTHHLYKGDLDLMAPQTREMLSQADVLVVIGVALFAQVFYSPNPLLSPETKVIQIDDNPWEIGKNYPVFSGIEGNIRVCVSELLTSLEEKITPEFRDSAQNRIQKIREEKRKEDAFFSKQILKEKDNIPIAPSRLMQEIKDNLRPGTRVVDDCWSCSSLLRRILAFSEDKSYQRSRNGGSIGWGLPGALGVKLASPDRPVVCVSGDGSAMWSIQTLWTAARYNIPVTFVICANQSYQQVRIMKTHFIGDQAKGRYLGTELSNPVNDFCKIAGGMGIEAKRVEDPKQLKETLKQAFSMDKANLVEVRIESILK
jgi:benzoylformate decarboxylase